MKKSHLTALIVAWASCNYFHPLIGADITPSHSEEVSLFQSLTGVTKKTKAFNLYFHMQNDFNVETSDRRIKEAGFNFRQLRIEIKGQVNDWISYRWRQRLTQGTLGSAPIDNLPNSIDWAVVTFKANSKLRFMAGKQANYYGGFEFDKNAIDVYMYSDMSWYTHTFMTGLATLFQLTPNHEFVFQVLNSNTQPFAEIYGFDPDNVSSLPSVETYAASTEVIQNVRESKIPLVYTLNWNGSLWNDRYKTRWSASILQEAKHRNMYYYVMGNQLHFDKILTYLDIMYSRESIDRKGIISEIIHLLPEGFYDGPRVFAANYFSLAWRFNYRLLPKLNLFCKATYETQGTYKDNDRIPAGKYRTAWGYNVGAEYFPMKTNLRFFFTFVGRTYNFTYRARNIGWSDFSSQRLSAGFSYILPVY